MGSLDFTDPAFALFDAAGAQVTNEDGAATDVSMMADAGEGQLTCGRRGPECARDKRGRRTPVNSDQESKSVVTGGIL